MTDTTTPAAGTDDRPPLREHQVTVTLARGKGDQRQTRAFTLTIPAVDEQSAKRGGIDIGLGINEASGYQWKLANDEDGPDVQLVDDLDPEPVHSYFGLTYANYLVLHRSLMQSMPASWQHRMVALLQEYDQAFAHVQQAPIYGVTPGREVEYGDLEAHEMNRLGIGFDSDTERYWDRDGQEHDRHDRLLIPLPGGDPVPHYQRGRTRIEPKPKEQ